MNERDAKNLLFLLSIDEYTMMKWYNEATDFEREYARQLLLAHERNVNFAIMLKADKVDERLIEANEVLTKIMEMK